MPAYYKSEYPSALNDPDLEYENAKNRYSAESDRSRTDRDTAYAARDKTRSAADAAVADFGARKPSALAGWTPGPTDVSTSQMASWLSALPRGGAPVPSRAQTGVLQAGAGPATPVNAPTSFRSENLEGFDPSVVTNFDPSAYGKEFAQGAYGDFKRQLGDELEGLEGQAVGAGRFRTGLYDEDQGRVVNRLGADFNDSLAQQAGVFSGQRLQALTSGTDFGYRRAADIDANARAIAELDANNNARFREQGAELDYNRGRDAMNFGLDADRLALEGYGAETDRYRLGQAGAEFQDEMAYRRGSDRDKLTYDQARALDEMDYNRSRTGLESALGRESLYLNDAGRSADRATEAASSDREWAARDRELAELRAEIERMRQASSGGPGRSGSTSGYAESAAQAKARRAYGL